MATPEESDRCAARRFGLRPTRLAAQRVIEDLHHVPGHQPVASPGLFLALDAAPIGAFRQRPRSNSGPERA